MKSEIQNLSRDSVLLLYIAGELGEQDRARVEGLLASDPALASELQALRDADELCRASLRQSDSENHPAGSRFIAGRNAVSLVRQWAIRRNQMAPAASRSRTVPWLRYGLSAAASLLLGYLVWTNFMIDRNPAAHSEQADARPDSAITSPGAVTSEDRAVPPQDQLALLSDSLDLSASDDASNMRLAAAGQTGDMEFFDNTQSPAYP